MALPSLESIVRLVWAAGIVFLSGSMLEGQAVPARKFTADEQRQLAEAKDLNVRARELCEAGKFQESIVAAQRALDIRLAILGEDHADISRCMNNLASCYLATGELAKAESLFVRSLAIREKAVGPHHPDTAVALDNLANLYLKQNNLAKAVPLLNRGLAAWEKILGPNHADVIERMTNLAGLYRQMGALDDAARVSARLAAIRPQPNGMDDWRAIDARLELAELERLKRLTPAEVQELNAAAQLNRELEGLYNAGQFRAAMDKAQKVSDIFKRIYGEESRRYAGSLNNLAEMHRLLGDNAQAEAVHRQGVEIRRKTLGEMHPEYALALHNLGGVFEAKGDLAQAEEFYRRAFEIRKQTLPAQHLDIANSLNNLAGIYSALGDKARAEPMYRQALGIVAKTLGEAHPFYASTLSNLALIYRGRGDYQQAERLIRQSLSIGKQARGESHPTYAQDLLNLALLLQERGEHASVEPLVQQALTIIQGAVGERHPVYAQGLNVLGLTCIARGDFDRGEAALLQALDIRKKSLGEQDLRVAETLNNLAVVYYHRRNLEQPELLLRESLEIHRAKLGPLHPSTATSMANLASVYRGEGKLAEAERLLGEAVEVFRQTQGEMHPNVALAMNQLALVHLGKQEYGPAAKLYGEALAITDKAFTKAHNTYAVLLQNVAKLEALRGDFPKSDAASRESLEITLRILDDAAAAQSERQQLAMSQEARSALFEYIDMAVASRRYANEVYRQALRFKGSVHARRRIVQVAAADSKLSSSFAELQSITSQLATLALASPAPAQQATWRRQLAELTEQKERLEQELSQASAAYRAARQPVTLEALQAALPAGSALIDFVEYHHFLAAGKERARNALEPRLAAFVVPKSGPVSLLDLGPAAGFADNIAVWRAGTQPAADARSAAENTKQASAAGERLRKTLWLPLAGKLAGARLLLISPDGPLGTFPIGALPGSRPDTYLIEEAAFVLVPSPTALVPLPGEAALSPPTDGLLAVGGVDYESPLRSPSAPGVISFAIARSAPRGEEPLQFKYLSGTKEEAAFVEQLYRRLQPGRAPTVLLGSAASETALRGELPRHRFVQLATHGFFAPARVRSALSRDTLDPDVPRLDMAPQQSLAGYHPNLLSGLVLAGANRPDSTGDDGILTAAEVQTLDLRKVDLVTLSACETGLGKETSGEGLLGLQRAFQVAGAKSVVASLWQVDDAATQMLMERFYTNLWEKKLTKLEALREAQLWMLREGRPRWEAERARRQELAKRSGDPALAEIRGAGGKREIDLGDRKGLPPYFWAAFVLSGDWR